MKIAHEGEGLGTTFYEPLFKMKYFGGRMKVAGRDYGECFISIHLAAHICAIAFLWSSERTENNLINFQCSLCSKKIVAVPSA